MLIRNKVFNHIDISSVYKPESYHTKEGDGRIYFIKNRPHGYYSITTVLSLIGKKKIELWRKRIGEKEADKISNDAKDRGNNIHEMIERYLKNEDRSFIKEYSSRNQVRFNQIRLLLNKNIDNILLQETILYSDIVKVAGRVDLVAEWNGVLSIIDFKGSNKLKKKKWIEHYFLQEIFYSLALYEMTKYKAKQIVTLIVGDDLSTKPFIEQIDRQKVQKLQDHVKKYYEIKGLPLVE